MYDDSMMFRVNAMPSALNDHDRFVHVSDGCEPPDHTYLNIFCVYTLYVRSKVSSLSKVALVSGIKSCAGNSEELTRASVLTEKHPFGCDVFLRSRYL